VLQKPLNRKVMNGKVLVWEEMLIHYLNGGARRQVFAEMLRATPHSDPLLDGIA
jgi:hypothetical protein